MRVLLVPSVFVPSIGGVQLNTLELARQLSSQGHSVIVLTSNWRQWKLPVIERQQGLTIVRLPFYVFRGSLKSLVAFIACFPIALVGTALTLLIARPDVVNVHFLGSNAFYIVLANKLARVPLVATLHGNEVGTVPDPKSLGEKGYTDTEIKWMSWAIKEVLQQAKRVTAVSAGLIERAAEFLPGVRDKATVLYMPGPATPNTTAVSEGVPTVPFILAVGRLARQKGFDVLLCALALSDEPTLLVVIGDGPENQTLEAAATNLGLKERVLFAGRLTPEQTAAYFRACQFVVVPSRWEGLPTVIWEAFRRGKCVVASAVCAIPEVVVEGETGLLVPPENPQLLAAALDQLVRDAHLRRELGRRAKRFAAEKADWSQIANDYAAVYREALGGRTPRGR